MYNETLKEKFLNSDIKVTLKNIGRTIFDSSEKTEEEKEKDLAFFSKEETVEFLNSRFTVNTQSIKKNIYLTNSYQAWATGVESLGDPITKEDIDFIGGIRTLVFKSPEALITSLEKKISLDEGRFTVAALCLAWTGLEIKDASQLLKEDIDLRTGLIRKKQNKSCNEQKIKIEDDIILKTLRRYQNTSVSYRTQNRTFEVYPQESVYFLRSMVTKNSKKAAKIISPSRISLALNEIDRSDSNLQISRGSQNQSCFDYVNVYKSGQLYRVWQLEKAGMNVLAKENRETFHSMFDSKGDYYDYVYLYKKYKEAFRLQ